MSATNRGLERKPQDLYETPAWLTRAILPFLREPIGPVLEPACGGHAIVNVLREHWPNVTIDHTDAFPQGDCCGIDFVLPGTIWTSRYDLIITNPPYSLATEFAQQALSMKEAGGTVALLMRLNWLGGQKRAVWMRDNTPSVYVTPRRPAFSTNKHGKPGTDATEYAWFIWDGKPPTIRILPTERT